MSGWQSWTNSSFMPLLLFSSRIPKVQFERDTHRLDLVPRAEPSAEDAEARKAPLAREPREERHRAALREAAEDDAARGDARVDLGGDELVERVHGLEHPVLVLARVDAPELEHIEPTEMYWRRS